MAPDSDDHGIHIASKRDMTGAVLERPCDLVGITRPPRRRGEKHSRHVLIVNGAADHDAVGSWRAVGGVEMERFPELVHLVPLGDTEFRNR